MNAVVYIIVFFFLIVSGSIAINKKCISETPNIYGKYQSHCLSKIL